jgi:hypothetical protein
MGWGVDWTNLIRDKNKSVGGGGGIKYCFGKFCK